jgi:hypothetical protein
MWWFLPFSCFCCLRIWLYAVESVLLSDCLSFLLLWFDVSFPLVVLFTFIFCVRNYLQNLFFCSGGLVVIYCFSFCLLWKIFIALSTLIFGKFLNFPLNPISKYSFYESGFYPFFFFPLLHLVLYNYIFGRLFGGFDCLILPWFNFCFVADLVVS